MKAIHVLVLDTVMDRGGAEAMIMNYMRNINRDVVKFDFLTNRDYRAAYEDEIEALVAGYTICVQCIPANFISIKKKLRSFYKNILNTKLYIVI